LVRRCQNGAEMTANYSRPRFIGPGLPKTFCPLAKTLRLPISPLSLEIEDDRTISFFSRMLPKLRPQNWSKASVRTG
jgi:hypothetical protein